MDNNIQVSIVLPVRNESGCIAALLREIIDVIKYNLHVNAEIIIVDDASDDDSVAIVQVIASEVNNRSEPAKCVGPSIRLIRHDICVGQSGALMDGFTAARGEIIVSMDADGQFDPKETPLLLERMGLYDMVCGIRYRRHDGLVRKGCSVIANSFRNLITGDSISDSGCTFRSMRRSCVEIIRPFQGKLSGCEFFFHPMIIRKAGFHICEINISHRPRTTGKSNYRLLRGRMWRGLLASVRIKKLLGRY